MRFRFLFSLILVGIVSVSSGFSSKAYATDKTDIAVGMKTLSMLNVKPSGIITVAVVYDPTSVASKADADSIKEEIDNGVDVPRGIKLDSVLVSTNELGKLERAKIIFIAKSVAIRNFDAISVAASNAGALSISTDIDCVKANKCVIGIVSKPNVEIYLSTLAAERAKIGFAQVFMMLTKQI
ncbi:MAG: hypothetical protein WC521_08690 [Bdellovibrionales bacterium]